MSRQAENVLAFRLLQDSPIVRVRDYVCRSCRGGPAAEEHSDSNNIVLLRHGVFCKHFGRRHVTADVKQAVFFSKRQLMTKCPVCDWEIKDGGIKVKVGGKEIIVCCDDCAKKAKESPTQYAGAAK